MRLQLGGRGDEHLHRGLSDFDTLPDVPHGVPVHDDAVLRVELFIFELGLFWLVLGGSVLTDADVDFVGHKDKSGKGVVSIAVSYAEAINPRCSSDTNVWVPVLLCMKIEHRVHYLVLAVDINSPSLLLYYLSSSCVHCYATRRSESKLEP